MVAEPYVSEILGHSWHDWADGGDPLTRECPDCDTDALVSGAFLADSPQTPVFFCFGCATIFEGLDTCTVCGRLFQPVEDGGDLSGVFRLPGRARLTTVLAVLSRGGIGSGGRSGRRRSRGWPVRSRCRCRRRCRCRWPRYHVYRRNIAPVTARVNSSGLRLVPRGSAPCYAIVNGPATKDGKRPPSPSPRSPRSCRPSSTLRVSSTPPSASKRGSP